jgi:subfamily B ATP-binding cassette protein MsbA
VLGPIRLLSNVSINLQKGVASAERVFEIFDTHVEIEDSPDAVDIPLFSNEIGFHKVCFNYDADAPVIQDVSFSIPRGKVVAIVGPSGAGKSTIADLIPRFYDVDSGSISIDGIDIRHVKLISLRSKMGIVTQETILFDETIEFNIAYGIEHYTQEKLNAATQAANAYDFILEQPQGFQTIIGEKGIKLSGGQRQRIAIARAILRNPPILILDEATSSLDTESERKVQLALENLMRDRTTLVIAHRLSTIQRADIIIVLDKGCIMETGNHLSLLNKGGLYQKLYENMSVK